MSGDIDESALGQQLQAARQAAGLTQQQLCAKANLSFSTLTKIERGAIKAPSIFTVLSIAETLNLSLDELVGYTVTGSGARKLTKTKSGVSFVYFDVNGCLVYFYQGAFAKISAATGVQPDIIESAYLHYNDEVCRGIISLEEFNIKLAERLGIDAIRWQDYYLDAVEPIQQMHEMAVWASQHYRVGLLSNIMPSLLTSMRHDGTLPDLPYDVIIDSSEVSAIKPEAKIFEIAQERAGVSPTEILFIDDSRVNLMAAERLDWRVMWFDDSHPEESVERVREALQPADA